MAEATQTLTQPAASPASSEPQTGAVNEPSGLPSAPASGTGTPTIPGSDGTAKGQPGQGAVSVTSEQYQNLDKSYKELLKLVNKQGTEKNIFRTQLDDLTKLQKQMLEAVAKASEAPYNPDEFMNGLRKDGPKFLENVLQKRLDDLKNSSQQEIASRDAKYYDLESKHELLARRIDSATYPDFAKMEPEMHQMLKEGLENSNLPFDPKGMAPGEVMDRLYQACKLKHSGDAVVAAKQEGKNQAEQELRREASAGVAGAGKHAGSAIPDLEAMSLADLRKYVVAHHGLVE